MSDWGELSHLLFLTREFFWIPMKHKLQTPISAYFLAYNCRVCINSLARPVQRQVSYLPPLVKGVYIPDYSLTKYLVFIHGCRKREVRNRVSIRLLHFKSTLPSFINSLKKIFAGLKVSNLGWHMRATSFVCLITATCLTHTRSLWKYRRKIALAITWYLNHASHVKDSLNYTSKSLLEHITHQARHQEWMESVFGTGWN